MTRSQLIAAMVRGLDDFVLSLPLGSRIRVSWCRRRGHHIEDAFLGRGLKVRCAQVKIGTGAHVGEGVYLHGLSPIEIEAYCDVKPGVRVSSERAIGAGLVWCQPVRLRSDRVSG